MTQSAHEPRLFETRHDLDTDTRQSVVAELNQTLAETTDLQTQVKHAHWNVKGPQFRPLHELFDEQATILAEHADIIAERATALGGHARGTARLAAEASRLPEFPADTVDGMACVEVLADRFALHGEHLREAIETAEAAGDLDTADLYTELSRAIDKQLWFLEAHRQGPEAISEVAVGAED
jgi:starvation-inducible DNA-binding protein